MNFFNRHWRAAITAVVLIAVTAVAVATREQWLPHVQQLVEASRGTVQDDPHQDTTSHAHPDNEDSSALMRSTTGQMRFRSRSWNDPKIG